MGKIDEVRSAMMQAMKSGEKERKSALSMLLSALKQKQIDKREELTAEEENAIVLREIKQAQETVETAPVDRTDIIDEAKFRISVMQEFAPKMMDEDEILESVNKVIADLGIEHPSAKDKGNVMKNLMPLVKGKAEGSLVNAVVSEKLN